MENEEHKKYIMATKKFIYKRGTGKGQVHIEGEYADTRLHVIFDQAYRFMPWIFAVICIIFYPKGVWLGAVWEWVRRKLPFLTLCVAVVGCGLLFSG